MSPMDRYAGYDAFAWTYNAHWGQRFVARALPVLEGLVLCHLPVAACILDLCCGTGQLAHLLTARGYRVTGLDGSEAMLHLARENAPEADFVLGDARDFQLPDRYHAVFSTFDSLNHVMHLEELAAVFHHVVAVLHDGGWFLFDLNMEAAYLSTWRGSFGIVEDDQVCVVRSSFYAAERTGRTDITLFRLEDGWQRTDLTLWQRCYSEAEVRSSLGEAGFAEIEAYDAAQFPALEGHIGRTFFCCRKRDSGAGSSGPD